MECVLQCTPLIRDADGYFKLNGGWQEILRFHSLGQLPDEGLIRAEFKQWLVRALEAYTPATIPDR